ncbi:hypothetical protein [Leisingera sp. F5]|uniref:hypothetical protein n=1 Tax=Leisingera sp. F5 TaxID=1813816 RepID=UPI000AF5508C|nr:hypothetical protein [Leisingera sp. F5]
MTGLLGAPLLLIPPFAALIGGPLYLVIGIPVMLAYMARNRPTPGKWALLAFKTQLLIFTPIFLLAFAAGGNFDGTSVFLVFGSLFAPLWGAVSGKIYERLERDFYKQTILPRKENIMLIEIGIYLGLGMLRLLAMALMILRIGTLLGDCPRSGRAARAGAVTIATGYAMVGLGGVILIGAAIPLLEMDFLGLLPALGLAAICLGLGFSHAVATLRAVVREALLADQPKREAQARTPEPESAAEQPA